MGGSLFCVDAELAADCRSIRRFAIELSRYEKTPTSRLGEEAGTHRVDGGVRSAVVSRLTTLPIDGTIVAHGWFLVYRASACVVPLRVLAVCYTLALLRGPAGRAMCGVQHA